MLAAALLSVEFIAGIQAYLLYTVTPIVGADLRAQQFYGLITGSTQVAMFLTMPLGPRLLHRFRVERLLLHLTWLSVGGGVLSAVAPSILVFLLGRVVSGLAAGALATVSLAAIITALPGRWRRAVLAGYNVMWVLTSLVGPVYAGWVASALSRRWALVLYLPLLVAARAVIARRLTGHLRSGGDQPLPLGTAVLLVTGVALLAVTGLRTLAVGTALATGLGGAVLAMVAARRLLPTGTVRARAGRPAALAMMGLVTGAYFGAAAIVGIVVHDLLDGTPGEVAVVLAGGGLGWAVAGLGVSRWPAVGAVAYRRRSLLGSALLVVGLLGRRQGGRPRVEHRRRRNGLDLYGPIWWTAGRVATVGVAMPPNP